MLSWFKGRSGADRREVAGNRSRLPHAAESQTLLTASVAKADQFRDAGEHAEAALAYRDALELAPWRTDLKVQLGNMCKDCGQLPQALEAYDDALQDSPDDADIHLQRGRALALMGRRPAALKSYRKALELAPTFEAALHELAMAGEPVAQVARTKALAASGSFEKLLDVTATLHEVRDRLALIETAMPSLATLAAIPAEQYALFEALFQVPPPPAHQNAPLFTIISAAEETPVGRVQEQLRALQAQEATNWKAVFYGRSAALRTAVEAVAAFDARVRWLDVADTVSETEAERLAVAGAEGWLLLLDHAAILHTRAIGWFASLAEREDATALCCDATLTDADGNRRLLARWGFDPDLVLQRNIWGNTIAIKAAAYAELASEVDIQASLAGRRSALLLNLRDLVHLPLPLVDVRGEEASPDHCAAVRRRIATAQLPCRVIDDEADPTRIRLSWTPPIADDGMSVIICTRDNASDCDRMVRSLRAYADQPEHLRILVVDNGTSRAADTAILEMLRAEAGVSVLSDPRPFNWSGLNNAAAEKVTDPILVFANDDMEMRTRGWDTRVRAQIAHADTGALGAKLLYPDETIQHAGVLFGWGGSVIHDGLFQPAASADQYGRWQMQRQVSAVTGAFLAIRRALFLEVGGFDERQLAISYSDIDLCLKLRRSGRVIRWDPDLVLTHFESKSRGLDHLSPEKRARDLSERRALHGRWGKSVFELDPYVNPAWHDATLPFRLVRPISSDAVMRYTSIIGTLSFTLAKRKMDSLRYAAQW
ncbi:tetratricopeptide repeat protein [Segnochrobactrum spirostomi]|uniref:Glycosyltransferase n=1 Tax=Segnochrobactrum spirostomi TaxID=2608987 RepID=A0A6A7Y8U3_9HYPH|nr:glycosyltransferase [Segnochrobactrum spirostomi]MQT15296.1 glycosyltransferase [Segnochrobactrum spirostomi]